MNAGSRPTGRDAVREALLDSASRLFAERGLRASLRDIADDANVNLGLCSRHFGTKENLLHAVLERSRERGLEPIAAATSAGDAIERLFAATMTEGRYVRTTAWMLLERPDQELSFTRYPTIDALRAVSGDDPDAELRLMIAMAVLHGWALFGDAMLDWFDHGPDDRADVEARVGELLRRFVDDTGTPDGAGDAPVTD